MKTAISLPDELFEAVERLAKRSNRRRSEVYAAALREYMARDEPDEVTKAMNDVLEHVGDTADDDRFAREAARQTLKRVEW